MSEQTPPAPDRPIAQSLERLGQDGEGVAGTLTAGKDQAPAGEASAWFTWGKRDQFGAGAAVQYAKDAWAAVAKFKWAPPRGGK
jgi:hypothetical protein